VIDFKVEASSMVDGTVYLGLSAIVRIGAPKMLMEQFLGSSRSTWTWCKDVSAAILSRIITDQGLAKLVRLDRSPETSLPTGWGTWRCIVYEDLTEHDVHVALALGEISKADTRPVLCRVDSEGLTGDVFGSQRCDCQERLHALELIA
jgi:hypothetical protein